MFRPQLELKSSELNLYFFLHLKSSEELLTATGLNWDNLKFGPM